MASTRTTRSKDSHADDASLHIDEGAKHHAQNGAWTRRLGHISGNRGSLVAWWRCHRRIIADYLLIAGERMFHILGRDVVAPASLTKAATPQLGGALTSPAQTDMDGPTSRP